MYQAYGEAAHTKGGGRPSSAGPVPDTAVSGSELRADAALQPAKVGLPCDRAGRATPTVELGSTAPATPHRAGLGFPLRHHLVALRQSLGRHQSPRPDEPGEAQARNAPRLRDV